jgi:4-hydroxy-tetrahydrodipicolinate synthase
MTAELRGVFTILATPFSEDQRLDQKALAHLVEWTLERGVQGLTILGIAGEVYKLTDQERDQVTATVMRQVNGRVPVVVGAGHPGGTYATVEYCRKAEATGAVGVMVAPPFIAKPSPDQMVAFYAEVGGAIGIPIVVQDEPVSTGVQMSAALIARIAREAPNCRYSKVEHLPSPPKFSEIAALVSDSQLGLFGGSGGQYFLEELQRGARGAMTGFAYPDVLAEIWQRWDSGDRDGATELFYRWLPLIKLEGQPSVNVLIRKEVLRRRGAIPSATIRRPGPTLDPGTSAEIDALLARLDG